MHAAVLCGTTCNISPFRENALSARGIPKSLQVTSFKAAACGHCVKEALCCVCILCQINTCILIHEYCNSVRMKGDMPLSFWNFNMFSNVRKAYQL